MKNYRYIIFLGFLCVVSESSCSAQKPKTSLQDPRFISSKENRKIWKNLRNFPDYTRKGNTYIRSRKNKNFFGGGDGS